MFIEIFAVNTNLRSVTDLFSVCRLPITALIHLLTERNGTEHNGTERKAMDPKDVLMNKLLVWV